MSPMGRDQSPHELTDSDVSDARAGSTLPIRVLMLLVAIVGIPVGALEVARQPPGTRGDLWLGFGGGWIVGVLAALLVARYERWSIRRQPQGPTRVGRFIRDWYWLLGSLAFAQFLWISDASVSIRVPFFAFVSGYLVVWAFAWPERPTARARLSVRSGSKS